jgi:hypothetical protein
VLQPVAEVLDAQSVEGLQLALHASCCLCGMWCEVGGGDSSDS